MTEKERENLWKQYATNKDRELRNKLVEEYAQLVKLVANKMTLYLGNNIEYEELCSYGVFGLIDAVDKFTLDKGVKFETYASLRIRGSILDAIRKMDWLPRLLRERQKQIQKVKADLQNDGNYKPTDEEIAKALGVDVDDYRSWETQLFASNLFYLDEKQPKENTDGYDITSTLQQDTFELPEEHVDKQELADKLKQTMELLTEKERRVIELLYYNDLNAKETAVVLEVSESRVSQLHTRALQKMRPIMGKYMGVMVLS